MTHVVTANCETCRYTECVAVCPVECFHGDDRRLYIDPGLCIDCGACVPACPVKAIADSVDLDEAERVWIAVNQAEAGALPVIRARSNPLPGADARRQALGYA